jgi:hypothetical protein
MDDVELALQPASEVAPDACTPAKKAAQEKSRANNLAQALDDDAGRTSTVQLDKPQASNTKADDDKVVENLGYSC